MKLFLSCNKKNLQVYSRIKIFLQGIGIINSLGNCFKEEKNLLGAN